MIGPVVADFTLADGIVVGFEFLQASRFLARSPTSAIASVPATSVTLLVR